MARAAGGGKRAATFLDCRPPSEEATGTSELTLIDADLVAPDRIAAAGPAGPWTDEHDTHCGVETFAVESAAGPVCVLTGDLTEDLDAEQRAEIVAALSFVAAARTALPVLLAEVRRLRGADRPLIVG